MKPTPKSIVITAAALLGTLACFLKFMFGMTFSDISKLGGHNKPSLGMFLAPFLFLLLVGGASLAMKRVARWHGIVGTLAGLFLMVSLDAAMIHGKFKPFGFLTVLKDGNIGGRLIVVCAVTALVTCIVCIARPDPKRA